MIYPDGQAERLPARRRRHRREVHSDDAAAAARALNRRQSFQALCAELGAHYLTRDENDHAKAGNLNNGLAHSEGELVAVFDADHVPARDFLRETVGFFHQDEKLFLVQTPHFFLNPDPIEKNIGDGRHAGRERDVLRLGPEGARQMERRLFLRLGRAACGGRRSMEVGGFHGSSVTEDAETALELHSRGWNSLYVDKPMIAGLQPETFDSFIGQRSRWARGMVQILLLKNPLFVPGLTLAQRLCYLSSSLFWLFPLSRWSSFSRRYCTSSSI